MGHSSSGNAPTGLGQRSASVFCAGRSRYPGIDGTLILRGYSAEGPELERDSEHLGHEVVSGFPAERPDTPARLQDR